LQSTLDVRVDVGKAATAEAGSLRHEGHEEEEEEEEKKTTESFLRLLRVLRVLRGSIFRFS
jgi:hypothetical protein